MNRFPTILFLLLLPLTLSAGDFDNWYFAYLKSPCKVTGEAFSSDNKLFGAFSGTTVGEVTPDGKSFTQEFEYVYKPENHTAKGTIKWIKQKDGVFIGSAVDQNGTKVSVKMTFENPRRITKVAKLEGGRTVETIAQLEADKTIHVKDTARTKAGEIAFVTKSIIAKAKKSKAP